MEYLDILDENGNKTGNKDTRANVHKLGLLHSEVAAFIYTEDGKLLLQQRKSNKATYAGMWSVTGGHVLAGESNAQAIVREIKEELGINVDENRATFVTVYKTKNVKDDIINNKFFSIYIVKISENEYRNIKIQDEELEDARLFTIEDVENIINNGDKMYKFPKSTEIVIKQIKDNLR